MKKIVIILLFTFCWVCGYSLGDSIPELNKRVLRICDSLMGKKIDNGDCDEFAYYVALRLGGGYAVRLNKKYVPERILPGDYIIIKKRAPIIYRGKEIKSAFVHVAFIHHRVNSNTFALIHQMEGINVCIENFQFIDFNKINIFQLRE